MLFYVHHIATSSSMEPIPTGVSPGKIRTNVYYYMQCTIHVYYMYLHTYSHMYLHIIMLGFQWIIDWYCIHTYVHMYIRTWITTFVYTMLLSLSRSTYAYLYCILQNFDKEKYWRIWRIYNKFVRIFPIKISIYLATYCWWICSNQAPPKIKLCQ